MYTVNEIKKIIIEQMPPNPVKRSVFIEHFGHRSIEAINQLMEEGKLLRVKRGYYSLSDELLDKYDYDTEDELPYIPTETVRILISSLISKYTLQELGQHINLNFIIQNNITYYTQSILSEVGYEESYIGLAHQLSYYRLTEEGIYLLEGVSKQEIE